MKFQVQRVNNSKGHLIYWKVVGYEGKQKITVKENGETVKFQPNQKRQANIYKDSLKPEEISFQIILSI